MMRGVRAATFGASLLLAGACSLLPATSPSPSAEPSLSSPLPSAAATEPGTSNASSPSTTGALPSCDEAPEIYAPDDWYREQPIYVANEMEDEIDVLRPWAAAKPGFVDLWIERDRHGWVTLAFTDGAEARQRELEEEFPNVGVVAVDFPLSSSELRGLQREVTDFLRGLAVTFGSGTLLTKGLVSAEIGYLEPELVAALNDRFAGQRVCISGLDPALRPDEGPQPQAGDGWRLLADQDQTGEPYRTGVAYDNESYEALWAEANLQGEQPEVDFENELVIWFGAVHSGSCPRMRLDDVVVDRDQDLVHADFTYLDELGNLPCTADANPHAYVVALERSRLPHGPFVIQLEPDPPLGGLARTIVDVDLSTPGATAGPGQIHRVDSSDEPQPLTPGAFIEDGFEQEYRQSVHCGVEWLGPLNDTSWRTDEATGTDWLPPEWQEAVEDEQLVLNILLEVDPPTIIATANGKSVTYMAIAEEAPGCD